jgi:hypothetical protein
VQTLLHYAYFWNIIDPYLDELALVRPSMGGFILKSLRHLHKLIMDPPAPAVPVAVPAGALKAERTAAANAANAAKVTATAAARKHADAVQQAYFDVMLAVAKFPNPRGLEFELRCGLAVVGSPMPEPCSLALPECMVFCVARRFNPDSGALCPYAENDPRDYLMHIVFALSEAFDQNPLSTREVELRTAVQRQDAATSEVGLKDAIAEVTTLYLEKYAPTSNPIAATFLVQVNINIVCVSTLLGHGLCCVWQGIDAVIGTRVGACGHDHAACTAKPSLCACEGKCDHDAKDSDACPALKVSARLLPEMIADCSNKTRLYYG